MMRRVMILLLAALLLAIVPVATVVSASPQAQQQTYVVQWGDTLFSIAVRFNTTVPALQAANNIPNPNVIFAGQVLVIPPPGQPPTPVPPTPSPCGTTVYVVAPGDYLAAIARRFNTTVTAIVQANNIANPNLIFPGQQLIIPTCSNPATPVPPTGVPPTGVPPTPIPPTATGTVTYVVQRGDTLTSIAQRFGTTSTAIAQANNISNPNLIFPGQVLIIPTGGTVVTPAPTPVPGRTATPGPAPTSIPSPVGFQLGGQVNSFAYPDQMRTAGMTWAKIQIRYNQGDPASTAQGAIDAARSRGFRVLLSVLGNPQQLGANVNGYIASYASYLGGVARLNPDAIEVWNEQNIDREWPRGLINPATYTQMLQQAYTQIKTNNANVLVISGAPAPTGFFGGCSGNGCDDDQFIRGMANAGAANYADCIGMHYNEGVVPPTATSGDPRGNPNHYTRYFPTMVNLYASVFPNKMLCWTELGYLSGEGYPPLPPAFAWASGTSVQEQAEWLAQAASLSRQTGRFRLMIVFNVDFTEFGEDPQAGFAIVRPGNQCLACLTLGGVMGT